MSKQIILQKYCVECGRVSGRVSFGGTYAFHFLCWLRWLWRNKKGSQKENIITQLYAVKNGYEKAIEEVFKAYPLDIFPDTTQNERDPIIEKYPGFIDRTSAMMGRHIAKVILERAMYFAREILEDGGGRSARKGIMVANIYKVYVDTTDDDVAVWTMEATCPAMAIKKVLNRVSYGKSSKMENFEISAELEVRNMTYAQYKAAQPALALDAPPERKKHARTIEKLMQRPE